MMYQRQNALPAEIVMKYALMFVSMYMNLFKQEKK